MDNLIPEPPLEISDESPKIAPEIVNRNTERTCKLASTPIDLTKARPLLRQRYQEAGFESHIPIFYARDPVEAAVIVHDLGDKPEPEFPLDLGLAELDAWADTIKPSRSWQEIAELDWVERQPILSHLSEVIESEYRLARACNYRIVLEAKLIEPSPELDHFIALGEELGWILPFKEAAVLIDRPLNIRLDAENKYHGDGVTAIEYLSGYGVYYWHGTILPKRYGSVPSAQWQAEWIEGESNPDIKAILKESLGL